jgi:para-aminobenzoate synthetase component II
VLGNREFDVAMAKNFDGVLISPGPGRPEEAGESAPLVEYCAAQKIPVLGICLGLQVIGLVFGARTSAAPELLHGRTSIINHDTKNVFANLPNSFSATRYHSLAIEADSITEELEISATSEDGTIMGIAHKRLKIYGVQFHPEAVLTEYGYELLANWLEICGDTGARRRANGLSALLELKN